MTKQKFVVKVSLDDAKKRTKALKTAVTMNGVVSVTLDDDKLVVIGDGTDSVCLTTLLRKKLGYADLISVGSAEEKKEEKKDDKKENKPQGVQSVTVDGDKLVVIGDGTDAIILTTLLRKKLGYADLISVTSGDEKKEKKENQPQGEIKNVQPLVYPYQYSYSYPYVYHEGAYDHYNFYSLV